MNVLTCEQLVKLARFDLLGSDEFRAMSGIMLCGDLSVHDDVPTACTDGWNVKIGRRFFEEVMTNRKQRAFIIAHENFHKLLKQLWVYQFLFDENPGLANVAADYVVNQLIVDTDPEGKWVEAPPMALLDARFKGMNTKQVFDILKSEGKGSGRGAGGGGGGECLDDHQWGEASKVSPQEQQQRDAMVQQAIRKARSMGSGSSGLDRLLEEICDVRMNWRDQLAEFVRRHVTKGKGNSTWRRPNRRFLHSGLYLPSSYSEAMGEIVVAIDTSGSIGNAELAEFVAHMEALCKQVNPSALRLIWWDCEFQGEQVFKPNEYHNIRNSLKPKGGGGTNPTCVFSHIEKHKIKPEVILFLTDGYVDWPSASIAKHPVLWGITSNETAPWGVTVQIKE